MRAARYAEIALRVAAYVLIACALLVIVLASSRCASAADGIGAPQEFTLPASLLIAIATGLVSGLTTWGAIKVTLSWHKSRLDGHDTRLNNHAARIRALEMMTAGRRRLPMTDAEEQGLERTGDAE